MQRLERLIIAAALVLATVPLAWAGQGAGQPAATPAGPGQGQPAAGTSSGKPASSVDGSVFLGVNVNDNSGDLIRVGAYDLLHQGALPQFGAVLNGNSGRTRFDFSGFNGGDNDDQNYNGRVDFSRYVKVSASYQRFLNRTPHDPLTYLDSAIATFVLRHDDLDPTAQYSNSHGTLNARVDATIPGLTGLKLFVSHRQDTRDGHHQSITLSHCANCHVTGTTKQLSEKTRDLVAGASLRWSRLNLEAAFGTRDFRDEAAVPTIVYDKAVHPQTTADVFLNRVSYDSRNGALPFDTVPAFTKNTQTVKATVDLPADSVATGHYTHSSTTNTDGNFGMDYSGGLGQVVVPMKPWVTMRASVRHYTMKADDVFVDLEEPVAPAGPLAGLTYAQAYPSLGAVDLGRESTLSRSPTEAELEFTFRPWRRTSIRAEYGYEALDRTFSEVENTTTNRLLFTGRSQLAKGLNARFRVEQAWINDPFTNVHAAIPTNYQLTQSPGNTPFFGQQYFEMYDSRAANLSGQPTSAFRGEAALMWSPVERASISAHYRTRQSTNDSLNYSDWHRSLHTAGVEAWFAPLDRVMLTAGYAYQGEQTDTLFTTLAFVG